MEASALRAGAVYELLREVGLEASLADGGRAVSIAGRGERAWELRCGLVAGWALTEGDATVSLDVAADANPRLVAYRVLGALARRMATGFPELVGRGVAQRRALGERLAG